MQGRAAAVALLLLLLACPVRADEEADDPVDPRRAEPEPAALAMPALWLSLVGSLGLERRPDPATTGSAGEEPGGGSRLRAAGAVVIEGAFDEVLSHRPRMRLVASSSDDEAPPPPVEPTRGLGLRATGKLAAELVTRALRASRTTQDYAALDDASTRARLSGLVPELRLRLAQVVDEDQALSPTEYDPDRVTASGGTSLWMEGRATFALDRLVFADQEVGLLRLRLERERAERALTDDVLTTFAAWQRARAAIARETTLPEERDKAEIDEAVAAARLDALSEGWFTAEVARATLTRLNSEDVARPVPATALTVGQDDADASLEPRSRPRALRRTASR